MAEPSLVRPHVRYRESFLAAAQEFIDEGYWDWNPAWEDFPAYVAGLLARETEPIPPLVPDTILWLVDDDVVFLGNTSIRHELNESLSLYGGHIGYAVRPTARRMGYGTLICAQAIRHARALGIDRILITCDDDNIGSQKIIEANGGVLENRVDNGRPALTRRYWVEAAGPPASPQR
jgi:predicted acetyltransferase